MDVIAMGYSGTGSSAITHLLSEYNNVSSGGLGTYEHVFLYVPHGIFDLEMVLFGSNSLYRSDAALNDFYASMKHLNDNNFQWFGSYRRKYGNTFMMLVDKFLDEIITYTRKGYWFNDYKYKKSLMAIAKDTIKTCSGRPIPQFGERVDVWGDGVVNYSFPNPEVFYKAGREFIEGYLNMIEPDISRVRLFDQLLLPQHLKNIPNYFGDRLRCIVFDRDPRDMFILSKYIWSRSSSVAIFPTEADVFVDFYSRLKGMEKKIEDPRILRLHFEDLVYRYDETVSSIEQFIGKDNLGEHVAQLKKFNPEISIKNTQNFRIQREWVKEIAIIETRMSDMLYDFPYVVEPKLEETTI